MDRRPCFQFYWLPPAFAKITRFFFSFSMFLLWFGLILCCAPFGLGGKQNFQCLGATGLEGLAGEYEPRTIKNQPQSHLCISLFPYGFQRCSVDSRKKCEFVDLGKLSMSRDQVMVSEEVPGAPKKVQRCRFGCFKDLPSTLVQVTKTGGDMR